MYTYFLKKYDCVKLGKFLSKKCKVSFFAKYIYQISIEFWITNTLLHKCFQTGMIFFEQFKVPTIKFGKCFAEFIRIETFYSYSSRIRVAHTLVI